jgi:hypothetical protein
MILLGKEGIACQTWIKAIIGVKASMSIVFLEVNIAGHLLIHPHFEDLQDDEVHGPHVSGPPPVRAALWNARKFPRQRHDDSGFAHDQRPYPINVAQRLVPQLPCRT